MGWDSTKKLLTYPFTKLMDGGAGDLELAVGRTCTSQADLFLNGTVNKWAKYKPQIIAGNPVSGGNADGTLTDAQRRVGAGDGSVYGLSISVTTSSPSALHNSTFDYTGRPTAPPYRAFDFIASKTSTTQGYFANAVPNPGGAFNGSTAYMNIPNSININCFYNVNNVNGVDLVSALFGDASPDLSKAYPAIVLGNGYYTLLTNADTNTPTPLYYRDSYPAMWYADFTKLVKRPSGNESLPITVGNSYPCTVFLMWITNLEQQLLTDLTSYFYYEGDGHILSSNPVPVPNVVNVSITIDEIVSFAVVPVQPVYFSGRLNCSYSVQGTGSDTIQMAVTFDGHQAIRTGISVSSSSPAIPERFSASDFGQTEFLPGTHNVSVTITRSGGQVTSGTYTVTI